jgi:putative transposase
VFKKIIVFNVSILAQANWHRFAIMQGTAVGNANSERLDSSMARKKRHSREEIAAKLAQAKELSAQGKLQSEIARTLGISVMTLHRWRNTPATPHYPAAVVMDEMNGDERQLVTDLLLEKMKLEELSNGPKSPTRRASR